MPLIAKFEAGYKAGAEAAKPGTKVLTKYLSTPQQNCSGFNDPAAGQEAAKGMYDGGADIVYAAAGGSGSGVFTAAAAANKKAIGVDSDQYLSADPAVQKTIMTSMVKRVNVAVQKFLTDGQGRQRSRPARRSSTSRSTGSGTRRRVARSTTSSPSSTTTSSRSSTARSRFRRPSPDGRAEPRSGGDATASPPDVCSSEGRRV